jgi:hypothetical protein
VGMGWSTGSGSWDGGGVGVVGGVGDGAQDGLPLLFVSAFPSQDYESWSWGWGAGDGDADVAADCERATRNPFDILPSRFMGGAPLGDRGLGKAGGGLASPLAMVQDAVWRVWRADGGRLGCVGEGWGGGGGWLPLGMGWSFLGGGGRGTEREGVGVRADVGYGVKYLQRPDEDEYGALADACPLRSPTDEYGALADACCDRYARTLLELDAQCLWGVATDRGGLPVGAWAGMGGEGTKAGGRERIPHAESLSHQCKDSNRGMQNAGGGGGYSACVEADRRRGVGWGQVGMECTVSGSGDAVHVEVVDVEYAAQEQVLSKP